MIGFVINLTYNLTNPFLMLIIELMQYITIYSKGLFADGKIGEAAFDGHATIVWDRRCQSSPVAA
jgi:hypothetical protein